MNSGSVTLYEEFGSSMIQPANAVPVRVATKSDWKKSMVVIGMADMMRN